ncbi:hypothetical protein HK405_007129, partial [Cladochytrium tenue]
HAAAKAARGQDPQRQQQKQQQQHQQQPEKKLASAPSRPKTATTGASAAAPITTSKRSSANKRLLIEPLRVWHQLELPPIAGTTVGLVSAADDARVATSFARAKELYEADVETFSRGGRGAGAGRRRATAADEGDDAPSGSDRRFVAQMLQSGTTVDKVAAVVLAVHESPFHSLALLRDHLVRGMARKRARREALVAVDAVKDLVVGSALLPDYRLTYFRDRPLFADGVTDSHLVLWYFEDQLKKLYFEYIQLLEELSKDPLDHVRKKALHYIGELLASKPEQEVNLLALLVNKLGDQDGKVASQASFTLLSGVLGRHPAMKLVVVKEVERLLFRQNVGSRARLASLSFLTQIPLSNRPDDVEAAGLLVRVYFSLFELLVKRAADARLTGKKKKSDKKNKSKKPVRRAGEKRPPRTAAEAEAEAAAAAPVEGVDARLMASLLTGVNRAFPYARLPEGALDKHLDALFAVSHSAAPGTGFNVSVQALTLIFQVIHQRTSGAAPATATVTPTPATPAVSLDRLAPRFYRALYETLWDRRLELASSRLPSYLNLLHRALRADPAERRVMAFVKRLAQICAAGMVASPAFVCAALFLIGDVARARPAVWGMVTVPEDLDDVETFRDAVDGDGDDGAAARTVAAGNDSGRYDGRKRDPLYCHADRSCLWELVCLASHFHPTVVVYARSLLSGTPIDPPENATAYDPLQNHTLARFLDRFVYKNPKRVASVYNRGASIMQGKPPAADAARGIPADADSANTTTRLVAGGKKRGAVLVEDGAAAGSSGIMLDDAPVNSDLWFKRTRDSIPVDERFFYDFFHDSRNMALREDGRAERAHHDGESDGDGDGGNDDNDDDDGESLDEDEVWEAMRRSAKLPDAAGDGGGDGQPDLGDDEDDDELEGFAEAMAEDDDDDDGEDDDGLDVGDIDDEDMSPGEGGWQDDDDDNGDDALLDGDSGDSEAGDDDDDAVAADATVEPTAPRRPPRSLRNLAETASRLGYKGDYFVRAGDGDNDDDGDDDDEEVGDGGRRAAAGARNKKKEAAKAKKPVRGRLNPFASLDEFEALIEGGERRRPGDDGDDDGDEGDDGDDSDGDGLDWAAGAGSDDDDDDNDNDVGGGAGGRGNRGARGRPARGGGRGGGGRGAGGRAAGATLRKRPASAHPARPSKRRAR